MNHWMFVHGAVSSRLTWTRQAGLFAHQTRVDLPDLGGDYGTLIDRLARHCLQQTVPGTVVVGHSMGGAIALSMARLAPERLAGLVLVGTGPTLPVSPAVLDGLVQDAPATLSRIARWSLARSADPALLRNSLALLQGADAVRAIREFKACSVFDATPWLAAVELPVTIIRGADDRMVPAAVTERFRDFWPEIPIIAVPEAGHLMMLEQPDRFNRILQDIADGWPS
ncbi:MAG: alpha/beta hydrolase [Thermaerobacter sp.]|nr:alpha/beta hydrolase [Thermaerobacter sp.]